MKGINLRERSTEIKFLLEKELRALTIPCSVADMVKRVGASRMPVMKHLESLLGTEEFSGVSIVRLGSTEVIYRVVAPKPMTEVEKHEGNPRESGSVAGSVVG